MPAPLTRLRSVDAFRGLTMAGMVIVNNPGDWNAVYAPLLHAEWHGWTPTDLIFPWFLAIMGVSMALAGPARAPWSAVLRRSATIVGLGLFMSGYPAFNPARWRIPGVLFRIGLCYLMANVVWRSLAARAGDDAARRRLLAVSAALLLGYWALLTLVAPPGGTAGDLTPAGNLGAWLDRTLLGGHLWQPDWDPEGLLSTLPAVATTLLGLVGGLWVTSRRPASAAPALAYGGVALVIAGLLWDRVFPINKSLWTSSYVLFTAGTAAIVLAALHHGLDDGRTSPVRDRVSEPLVALGRNAILLFVLSGLIVKTLLAYPMPAGSVSASLPAWIFQRWFAPLAAPRTASLLYATAFLALLYALLAWLHRRRWYWSV
jgi:predicted acyltransferase